MRHFLFAAFFAFISCKPHYDVVEKQYRHRRHEGPPGCVKLNDTLCIDRHEIRNIDYLEFVNWTKKFEPEKYESVYPDTNVWKQEPYNNTVYARYYFIHPAYRSFPVVGVSYDQAVAFCKWRTDRVRYFGRLNGDQILYDHHVSEYYYRLPTREEWEFAASAGMQDKEYGFEQLAVENVPRMNVKETYAFGGAPMTEPVSLREPNRFGIRNMIGNVAEMILVKGVSKGGSWEDPLETCRIGNCADYAAPSASLGFRCVCILVK